MSIERAQTIEKNSQLWWQLWAANEAVAKFFNKPVQKPKVLLVSELPVMPVKAIRGKFYDQELLGDCNILTAEIRVKVRPGWRRTYIHELVHLYNTDRSEAWVKTATKDCIGMMRANRP